MNQSDLTPAQLQYLVAQARAMQNADQDYREIACSLPCDNMLINYGAEGVWLVSMPTQEVTLDAATRLLQIMPNPCHMVCEGVADPVGAAIADDMAEREAGLRFKQGVNADGGVTLTRVQQVALYSAVAVALEVNRLVGAEVVTIEVSPTDEKALRYIVKGTGGESVMLKCSETSLQRLAQMAALILKG